MSKFIVDSSAWIEYFSGSLRGAKIKEIIEKEGSQNFITGLVVAEVCAKYFKGSIDPKQALLAMHSMCSVLEFDFKLGYETARAYVEERKKKEKFGLADAHILAASRLSDSSIITCDADFSGIVNAIIIK